MLGNFKYYNPTKIYFGENSIEHLDDELKKYGKNITIVYGSGSIKKNGIYDKVIELLKANNKVVSEISGVMPNPTLEKLYEGIEIAQKAKTDFLLAIGGGSVIDYTKGLAASIHCKEDPWNKYYLHFEEPTCQIVPLGSILTMVGTGSEMNTGSVITNKEQKLKIGKVFQNEELFPKFSILDPTYTFTLPHYQMVAGIYDIFSHICEQYFSNTDDNTSDYLAEGLMRSLIVSSRVANKDPFNYEARSNIMWTATWALNTLINRGKNQDWMVHMLGQAIGAVTNATHGMTLAAVSDSYYKLILPYGLDKFVRFAINVWNVDPTNLTKEEVANLGLEKMKEWMQELGLVLDARTLGVNEDNLEDVVNATLILSDGYKTLTKDEVRTVLVKSMK